MGYDGYKNDILSLIEKHSTAENGAEISLLIQESGMAEEEAESVMQELMKEGEIFAPKPGFLKSI